MANVTHVVQVARGVSYGTVPDPGDWDSILSLAQSISASRFDVNQSDSGSAGSATFNLFDVDRSFDPETDSTLKPGLPIRWQVVHGATTYDRWYGYVEGISLVDRGPSHTDVTITAHTALAELPKGISSPWDYEVFNNGGGDGLWMLEEESQSTRNLYGSQPIVWVNPPDATSEPLIGAETWYHSFDGDQYGRSTYPTAKALPVAFETVVKMAATVADGTYTVLATFDGTNSLVIQAAVTNASDSLVLTAWSSLKSASNGVSVTVSLADWQTAAHVVAYRVTSGAEALYVDGVAQTTSSVSAPTAPTQVGLWVGGGDGGGRLNFVGDMSAVAAFKADPGAANLLIHYNAIAGWTSHNTYDRAGYLLDMAGWPSGLRDLDGSGLVRCATFDHTGREFQPELRVLAATENGALFVSGDGKITTHDRLYYATDAGSVTATFSDDGAALFYRIGVVRDYDWKDIVSSVTASSRPTGDSYTASSSTAPTQRAETIETVAKSQAELETLATAVLDRLDDFEARIPSLEVDPQRDPANLYPALLGLELGDRVQWERTPQSTGSQLVKEFVLVGVSDRVDARVSEWGSTVLSFEPAVPAATGFWNPGTSSPTGTDVWAP